MKLLIQLALSFQINIGRFFTTAIEEVKCTTSLQLKNTGLAYMLESDPSLLVLPHGTLKPRV
jgi:hypothetical protein